MSNSTGTTYYNNNNNNNTNNQIEYMNNEISNGSTRSSLNTELCKYFVHGVCRFGDNCFYSHDLGRATTSSRDALPLPTSSLTSNQPNTICKYFLLGRCMFGDNCFNQHIIPSSLPTEQSTTVSSNSLLSGEIFNAEKLSLTSSSTSSSASSPNESTTNDNIKISDNSSLVKRFTNKPKLLTTNLTDEKTLHEDQTNYEMNLNQDFGKNYSPLSYYEALTGKKLNNNEEFNDLDLSMFDENYIDYMKRKRLINESNIQTNQLCPYFEKSLECPFEQHCEYTHGDVCDLCNMACLNPFDAVQREEHKKECMKLIEKDMEEAFAIQRSSEKLCGICMEVVWEKEKLFERRFGILENCNHCYCLECIRKWRSSKSYENKIVKACPECRVKSDYVTPSKFWFENEDNKKKIIDEYKNKLGKTACKYFKQGDGTCPFGNKCFYLHQNKDGTIAHLPEPTKRRRFNREGSMETYSNVYTINLNFSDDEDDEFDLMYFLTQNLIGDTDTESDFSDLFELSSEFLNLF